MKKIIVILFVITILFNFSFAFSLPDSIRIGLSYGSSAVDSFTVSAPHGVMISDIGKMKGTVTISKSGSSKIKAISSSKTKSCAVDDEYGVSITPIEDDEFISYNGKEYRGALVIFRFDDSDMTVINVLDLEEYLYGVVPRELATGHPIEALKAQAVAARTYTATQLNKYEKWNFDLTNTTSDQSYGGVAVEADDTTKAVNKTKGEIVTYDGKPITTYYFSTSSGYTENSENVWTAKLPYLVAVEDKYQSKNLSTLNWTVTFTKDEIEEILEKKSQKIGNLLSVNILKKSPSNGVLELEFEGDKDSYKVAKETSRLVFGTSNVKSQFYDIETDASVYVVDVDGNKAIKTFPELRVASGKKANKISNDLNKINVKGKNEIVKYSSTPTKYTLNGKGWGHGVGMSQNGAIGMAKEGFSYDEILKWYYTGVEIEEL